jgi:hypothetical protein
MGRIALGRQCAILSISFPRRNHNRIAGKKGNVRWRIKQKRVTWWSTKPANGMHECGHAIPIQNRFP